MSVEEECSLFKFLCICWLPDYDEALKTLLSEPFAFLVYR